MNKPLVFESTSQWIKFREQLTALRRSIGFVPTMGALHAGHLSLIEKSLRENDFTLVSLFVNPTQFNSQEDLQKYPRNIQQDVEMITDLKARLAHDSALAVMTPHEGDIYPDGYRYRITESDKSKLLCGAFRPGHFDGVLTVVMKLLGLAQANRCYMGEKDYQQFLLVTEMAKNFFSPTVIVPCPIVREASGLAMSSRNERLSATARQQAALIYQTLKGNSPLSEMRETLTQAGFQVEYLEELWGRRFVAAWIENVRLIDNVEAPRTDSATRCSDTDVVMR